MFFFSSFHLHLDVHSMRQLFLLHDPISMSQPSTFSLRASRRSLHCHLAVSSFFLFPLPTLSVRFLIADYCSIQPRLSRSRLCFAFV
ncbi:uncharacterized protein BDW47DRAFT_104562 [Aspergillus candidus]|uniref:Uncharacterized protein n=1 Tax=Aspergillus candidus TaxID=41067 RepID=A0A2I2FDB7_ASPCN|nr:hypothetical protein BDW47DRAFT_104562 [Aspergillus candidus]PLB38612.1 hypothetical protein BDW47DRAFT_104562 [Aspergillus candidus]